MSNASFNMLNMILNQHDYDILLQSSDSDFSLMK